jgi:hypothetical protein
VKDPRIAAKPESLSGKLVQKTDMEMAIPAQERIAAPKSFSKESGI